MSTFLAALQKSTLLSDGAMGTQLQAHGLNPGESGDSWNLDFPDRVLSIQQAYVQSGSDCLTTNTFQACSLALERHGKSSLVREINIAGVDIARRAFGDRDGYVFGDVGPFGGLMEPYGTATEQDVRASFREQIRALLEGGVDAILIETQTALEELGIAVEEAKEADAPCIIVSVSFDVIKGGEDVKTMMGIGPEQAGEFIQKMGAHVIGTNCGTGVDIRWAAKILARYRKVCDLHLLAQPNAGKPELEEGSIVYREGPDEFAQGLEGLLSAGARVVGACCGSSPEHIRTLRSKLERLA